MENIKIHKSDDFVSGIFRSSPSEVLKKILVLNFFKNPRKYILESSPPFKKVFEYLRMATSGGSDDKICFSIITGPLNPIGFSFEEIRSQKNISYKEKDLIK